jgi:hypothetical protein
VGAGARGRAGEGASLFNPEPTASNKAMKNAKPKMQNANAGPRNTQCVTGWQRMRVVSGCNSSRKGT